MVGGLVLCLAQAVDASGGIWVVGAGNARIGPLSRQQVAELFLNPTENTVGLKPLDRQDPALRERFYRGVSGMSPASVRAYWAKRVFTGRGRPPAMLDTDSVLRRLAEDPKAVTYLPAGELPDGAVLLLQLDTEKGE